MAKFYGFDEEGRQEYRKIRKAVLGGNRQTKLFKKWQRGRSSPGTGGGSANVGLAAITTEVTAKTEAGGSITFGVGEAVRLTPTVLGEASIDTLELNPDATAGNEFKIYNFCSAPIPEGKIVHWSEWGDTYAALGGPMKFVDAEDCS